MIRNTIESVNGLYLQQWMQHGRQNLGKMKFGCFDFLFSSEGYLEFLICLLLLLRRFRRGIDPGGWHYTKPV